MNTIKEVLNSFLIKTAEIFTSKEVKELEGIILTQERLKELYSYDPDSGDFMHTKKRRGVSNITKPIGTMDKGYIRIRADNNLYRAHRLAWLYENGEIPNGIIDHIDHNKINNAINNLRLVNSSTNSKNLSRPSNNTSGYAGVFKDGKKWRSKITVNGNTKYLGTFDNKAQAILARKDALKEYGFHKNHGL